MLRPYQQQAIDEILAHIRNGETKILVHLATGGGKTTVFCEILKRTKNAGNSGVMAVRGRKLVDQAHKRLQREEVIHGVLMAKHWNFQPRQPVQVCSIDTIASRVAKGELYPEADVVVIDEAHQALSPQYIAFCNHYSEKGAIILAFTATPYVTKSMRHFANVVVKTITTQDLMDEGFLVDADYLVPSKPDLSKVRVRGDDYVTEDLEQVMGQVRLIGNAVDTWKKHAQGRPSIYFCVSVKHSNQVAAAFREAGIQAVHCDAETPEAEREKIIKDLEMGFVQVVCNVGIFCTGVDIPPLSCVGMLRPTESYNLYIQQAGRGTRPIYEPGHDLSTAEGRLAAIFASNKRRFLLIDHAGNVRKHGKITEELEYDLDGKIKKFMPSRSVNVCEICFAGFYGPVCPCGTEKVHSSKERETVVVDGELVKLEDETEEEHALRQLERVRKMRGHKMGWLYHEMKRRFGEETAKRLCPQQRYFWAEK